MSRQSGLLQGKYCFIGSQNTILNLTFNVYTTLGLFLLCSSKRLSESTCSKFVVHLVAHFLVTLQVHCSWVFCQQQFQAIINQLKRRENRKTQSRFNGSKVVQRGTNLLNWKATPLRYITMYYIIIRYFTLCYNALHNVTSHQNALHNVTLIHTCCNALHNVTSHYNALHNVTLQCIK